LFISSSSNKESLLAVAMSSPPTVNRQVLRAIRFVAHLWKSRYLLVDTSSVVVGESGPFGWLLPRCPLCRPPASSGQPADNGFCTGLLSFIRHLVAGPFCFGVRRFIAAFVFGVSQEAKGTSTPDSQKTKN
jgi:hypothetical protein